MIGDRAAVERRDAPHGVDDVLVEAGKEAEAVLARDFIGDRGDAAVDKLASRGAGAVVLDRHAARLAAGDVAPFENDDLEAALDQLVSSRHAADAGA